MLDSLGLCDGIDNIYIAGTFEDDFSLKAEAMGWSLVEAVHENHSDSWQIL